MAKKKQKSKKINPNDLYNDFLEISEGQELYELFLKESKKKAPSKTELKLKNKLAYAKTKLRAKKKLFKEFMNKEYDKRSKIKASRQIDKYIKKGKSYAYNTMYNGILNEVTKENSNVYLIEQKLKKFKKKKSYKTELKKGEKRHELGKVWDSKDIENSIFKNQSIKTVNGLNIKKDSDEVLDLLNQLKSKISAYESIWLYYGRKGIGRLVILEDEFSKIVEK